MFGIYLESEDFAPNQWDHCAAEDCTKRASTQFAFVHQEGWLGAFSL